jgi:hypothetical protein
MSGPKSARYTLTPEQRRILAEARERERKTKRELDKLQQYRGELVTLKERLSTATTSIDMLVDRIGDGNEVQRSIQNSISQIETIIQESAGLSKQRGLEKLQVFNSKVKTVEEVARKIVAQYESQSNEINAVLSKNIEDSITDGMLIRIDDEIVNPQSYLESQIAKIKDTLHEIQSSNVSSDLQKEGIIILERAQRITDDSFIDNYYAMTVLPYIKRCKAYEEQIKEYGEEFDELASKHRYYSEYLGMPVISFTFSMDSLNSLRREVAELESQSAKIEEQQYISESLNQVMRDMGYNVVGSREVVKKSGRKFRNELYHFSEGSVVNVTYAANGQISMELGGVDTCDREPSEEESFVLCDEMVEFCDEFPEIERRLKEKGVVLMNRISMLPPAEEYTQIINVSDFNMTEKVDVLETASKKQTETRKQVLRKE